eukprot:1540741-Ditylum_brightwellii.AAC.1
MAYHNLCSVHEPPLNLRSLLGLGLKFCPTKRFSYDHSVLTLHRFCKDLCLKKIYAGERDDPDQYNPKMYISGNWQPLEWMIPPIITYRLASFTKEMEPLFPKRFARNNLLPYHQTALCFLKNKSKFLVIN